VNSQTHPDWEHVVVVDGNHWNLALTDQIVHPQRKMLLTVETKNWGNKQRHLGWNFATGDYVIYLDDDNYLSDEKILEDIAIALADLPKWAIFPMHRHGWYFFNDPPGMCMTDTLNVVVQREIGRWSDIEAREADGVLVEALREKYPYAAFPNFRPIGVMETSSGGV
jgi:glycosyltransferase involved in cell wall biosynthesis